MAIFLNAAGSGGGGVSYQEPASFTTSGGATDYDLSAVLPSLTITGVDLLFDEQGQRVKTRDWTYTGTTLHFNYIPADGDVITLFYH